jgi:Fic family protein
MKIESNQIIAALSQSSDAIGIESLMQRAAAGISKATLLRRLEELLSSGLVKRTGKARATRYALTPEARRAARINGRQSAVSAVRYNALPEAPSMRLREPGVDDPPEVPAEDPAELGEREHIRALIRRPLSQRPRVDCQRDFLDAYRPNVDFYLPAKLREELLAVGRTDDMARLPAGTYIHNVFQRVLIDLAWNSSRLEGNTFSLLETDRLLALGSSADPSRVIEARMILNHKEAIEFLVGAPDEIGFNRYTILNLHALLASDLLETSQQEGRLRQIAVGIGGCRYLPLSIPQVIEECFMQILDKAGAIDDPLEAAFFCMVHLPYLQPFVDVNKRVSRLVANIPLIRENMAPLTFADVPVRDYTDAILAVYELNRVELLCDVFARAYSSSAGRYTEVRRALKVPDAALLAWHEEARGVAREVVQGLMDKASAAEHIRRWSMQKLPAADRARVVELVEASLLSLHLGNIAKYRLRPSEFTAWHAVWTRQA